VLRLPTLCRYQPIPNLIASDGGQLEHTLVYVVAREAGHFLSTIVKGDTSFCKYRYVIALCGEAVCVKTPSSIYLIEY